eukprot:m.59421 g.59421  ORF g.59421 m.59421 type:complete len:163 (+) comp11245_c0_seq2:202-690(+)
MDTNTVAPKKTDIMANDEVKHSRKRKKRTEPAWPEDGKVCIVGGGIGGLGLALALQKRGIKCHVFERDASMTQRPQGYGMTMSTTNKALQELGILEELRERDTISESHYVFDSKGHILGYFGGAFCTKKKNGQRGNLRVPRQVLYSIPCGLFLKDARSQDTF